MTSEVEGAGENTDHLLGDMVRDADEYLAQLRRTHASATRLHVLIVGFVVWFAAFVVLGTGVYFTIPGSMATEYLLGAFLAAIAIGAAAGAVMYAVRRKRGFKFAELGELVNKMKQGKASSEEGLRLIDMMHGAALTLRKQKMDSAFEYGVAAFILVSIVGLNAGIGALAGVVVYLYFRFEATRAYDKDDRKYEESKKDLLLSL
jgi:ABC-type multidrug transport system fused ATPase/permease subunit